MKPVRSLSQVIEMLLIFVILVTLPKNTETKKFNFSSLQNLCLDGQKLNFFRRTHYCECYFTLFYTGDYSKVNNYQTPLFPSIPI